MVEIYSYGVDVNEQYARGRQLAETFQKQYYVPAATGGITEITSFQHLISTPSTVTLLNGLNLGGSVAKFTALSNYFQEGGGGFYLLGSPARQEADKEKIDAAMRQAPEDSTVTQEGEVLAQTVNTVQEINRNAERVRDNILRFIQG